MSPNYGYDVLQTAEERVFTLQPRQSAVNKTLRYIAVGGYPFFVGFAFGIDTLLHVFSNEKNSHGLAIMASVFGLVGAVAIWFCNGPSSTEFRLAKDKLRSEDGDFDKSHIANLGVQSPNSPVVTGRNAFELNMNIGTARSLLSTEFSVVFDYGMNRVQLLKHLSQPQAFAVAREIDSWLAA